MRKILNKRFHCVSVLVFSGLVMILGLPAYAEKSQEHNSTISSMYLDKGDPMSSLINKLSTEIISLPEQRTIFHLFVPLLKHEKDGEIFSALQILVALRESSLQLPIYEAIAPLLVHESNVITAAVLTHVVESLIPRVDPDLRLTMVCETMKKYPLLFRLSMDDQTHPTVRAVISQQLITLTTVLEELRSTKNMRCPS